MRASDEDRARAANALRDHHLAGRLDLETFEERTELAMRATSLSDLEALMHDLPGAAEVVRPRAAEQGTVGVPWFPGVRDFGERKVLPAPPHRVAERLRDVIAPSLGRLEYHLEQDRAGTFVFMRRYRPTWTYWIAVFLFPVGLIALLDGREDRNNVRLRATSGGDTVLLAYGRAPLPVRKAFAQLDD